MTGAALAELPVVRQLLESGDPTLEYKARLLLLEEPEDSARLRRLRAAIADSDRACSLLAGREPDGTIAGPYRKWQGPHWTLYSLALIDYPPGDPQLLPLREQVYDWLLDAAHLEFRQSLLLPGQEDRFRRCASQEGNAIWYSIRLGIDDERTRELAQRLQRWQWPDGGWNCDKRPQARTSSVIETLIPLRGLSLAASRYADPGAARAGERAAEFFLKRRLPPPARRPADPGGLLPHPVSGPVLRPAVCAHRYGRDRQAGGPALHRSPGAAGRQAEARRGLRPGSLQR